MADAAPEPLITDVMRKQIGVRNPPVTYEVDKLQIRLFARAVGHTDLIFYDEAEAKKAGYRSLPCPPGYLGTPVFDPNNQTAGRRPELPTSRPLTRILNGGTEYEYLDDICAGDVLTVQSYVGDYQERKGSIGDMVITTTITEYRNQDGKLVARGTGSLISY